MTYNESLTTIDAEGAMAEQYVIRSGVLAYCRAYLEGQHLEQLIAQVDRAESEKKSLLYPDNGL